jgi:hypothetical protein
MILPIPISLYRFDEEAAAKAAGLSSSARRSRDGRSLAGQSRSSLGNASTSRRSLAGFLKTLASGVSATLTARSRRAVGSRHSVQPFVITWLWQMVIRALKSIRLPQLEIKLVSSFPSTRLCSAVCRNYASAQTLKLRPTPSTTLERTRSSALSPVTPTLQKKSSPTLFASMNGPPTRTADLSSATTDQASSPLEDENFRPLNEFGEERRSRRIARAIVRSRLECVELIHIPPRPGQ